MDEFYDALIVEPLKSLSDLFLFRFVDVKIVDGAANGIGKVTTWAAEVGKRLQTGQVQTYALFMALGALVAIGEIKYEILERLQALLLGLF